MIGYITDANTPRPPLALIHGPEINYSCRILSSPPLLLFLDWIRIAGKPRKKNQNSGRRERKGTSYDSSSKYSSKVVRNEKEFGII